MASEIKPPRSPGESEAAAVAMAGWAGALCFLAATRAQPTHVNTGSEEGGPQQSPSGETLTWPSSPHGNKKGACWGWWAQAET